MLLDLRQGNRKYFRWTGRFAWVGLAAFAVLASACEQAAQPRSELDAGTGTGGGCPTFPLPEVRNGWSFPVAGLTDIQWGSLARTSPYETGLRACADTLDANCYVGFDCLPGAKSASCRVTTHWTGSYSGASPRMRHGGGHSGLDISTGGTSGVPAFSVGDCRVVRSEYSSSGWGNIVQLECSSSQIPEGKIFPYYAHLERRCVQKDQRVAAGQVIGIIGTTGSSTGIHLHFAATRARNAPNTETATAAFQDCSGAACTNPSLADKLESRDWDPSWVIAGLRAGTFTQEACQGTIAGQGSAVPSAFQSRWLHRFGCAVGNVSQKLGVEIQYFNQPEQRLQYSGSSGRVALAYRPSGAHRRATSELVGGPTSYTRPMASLIRSGFLDVYSCLPPNIEAPYTPSSSALGAPLNEEHIIRTISNATVLSEDRCGVIAGQVSRMTFLRDPTRTSVQHFEGGCMWFNATEKVAAGSSVPIHIHVYQPGDLLLLQVALPSVHRCLEATPTKLLINDDGFDVCEHDCIPQIEGATLPYVPTCFGEDSVAFCGQLDDGDVCYDYLILECAPGLTCASGECISTATSDECCVVGSTQCISDEQFVECGYFGSECGTLQAPRTCARGSICRPGLGCVNCGYDGEPPCAGGSCLGGAVLSPDGYCRRSCAQESCNGLDDDCDGQIDDVVPSACYNGPSSTVGVGVCRSGISACSAGVSTCIGQVTPAVESCNAVDDDCDGMTDEGVSIACTSFSTCSTFQSCSACPLAPAEVCDAIDNNCDGRIDEGCACSIGQTRSCYTGPLNTSGIGICVSGVQTCEAAATGSSWSACRGEVTPQIEACDSADNDCDGNSNEGLQVPCSTSCGTGFTTCQVDGTWSACSAPSATLETCDMVDNDCDGFVDELLSCALTNILVDGDFEAQESLVAPPWYGWNAWLNQMSSGAGSCSHVTSQGAISGNTFVRCSPFIASNSLWEAQLTQGSIQLVHGASYRLSFWARSGVPRSSWVSVQQENGSVSHGLSTPLSLTETWQYFDYSFIADTASGGTTVLGFWYAGSLTNVDVDGVSLARLP